MHYYEREIAKRLWMTMLIISHLVACGSLQNTCPVYCSCSLRNSLNHADCSGAHLISPYTAVPYEVQSLDLSYNDITMLDNDCFKGYIHLINISISNNAIQTILLETFVPLKRMRAIDLSHNRLESIDPRIFEANRKLQTLNLAGNKFMSLNNAPFLKSRYLRAINLAHAQINVLLPQHYSELAQLRELDLTHNLIITIDKFAENAPKLLRTLKLQGNNLNCDQSLKNAIKLLEVRQVEVSYNSCQVVDAVLKDEEEVANKFERIELFDEHVHRENEAQKEDAHDEDLGDSQEDFNETIRSGVLIGWHLPDTTATDYEDYYTDFEVDQNDSAGDALTHTQTKTLNETCHLWCLKLLPTHSFKHPVTFVGKQYTDFDVLFVFICGIAVGVAFTVFIGSCVVCIWRCATVLKSTHIRAEDLYDSHYAARTTVDTIRAPSAITTETAHEHTPIVLPQPPRRRQRRTPTTQRALVRHDQFRDSVGDNFISRLFGRPARHQYYRTINENTAHLIRRLSRSNLFNNRLSQHFGDRERNTTNSPPNTPDSTIDVGESAIENELEAVVTATRTPHRRRPETPPPQYSEIVAKVVSTNS